MRWIQPWFALLVFGFVPLLVISRIDSVAPGLKVQSIVIDLAVLVLCGGGLSIFPGLAFACAGRLRRGRHFEQWNVLAASVVFVMLVIQYTTLWIKQFAIAMPWSNLFSPWKLVVSFAIVFVARRAIINRWKDWESIVGKAAIVVSGAAFLVFISALVAQQTASRPSVVVSAASRPNIILISFDALRADELGIYGYQRDTAPNLTAFAKTATTFTGMIASANSTSPAVASLLTGLPPSQTGVVNIFRPLRHEFTDQTLGVWLQKAGYKTFASVGNPVASPNWLHVQRGFDDVFDGQNSGNVFNWAMPRLANLGSHALLWAAYIEFDLWSDAGNRFLRPRPARPDAVFERATRFISETRSPFFLWVHTYQPHDPYAPPAEYQGRFMKPGPFADAARSPIMSVARSLQPDLLHAMRAAYDENLLYVDAEFGSFIDKLKKAGLFENALILVTGDHGESFGKGGYVAHGHAGLYQDVIQVPLLIKMPAQKTGKIVRANAQTTDIMPTLLEAIGEPMPPTTGEKFNGVSLLHSTQAIGAAEPKYSEAADLKSKALVWGQYKLIRYRGSLELFDLSRDPAENVNLMTTDPILAQKILNDAEGPISKYLGEL